MRVWSRVAAGGVGRALPALVDADVDSGCFTGNGESGMSLVGSGDIAGNSSAIFEGGHSSSPLLKIAATFFERTNKGAVSGGF